MSSFGKRNDAFFSRRDAGTSSDIALDAVLKAARKTGSLSLTSRDLSDIPLRVFSVAIPDDGEKFWEVEPLTKLDLSFNRLAAVPDEIGALQDLLLFKARNNIILNVSDALFSCTQIRHLDLSNNEIKEVDDNLSNLRELTDLILAENKIRHMPLSLENCSQMKYLDLSHNELESFPEINLIHLVYLNLAYNRIIDLPDTIGNFKAIEELILRNNRLEYIPDLSFLFNLKVLDAMNNKITTVPNLPSPKRNGKTTTSKLSTLNLSYCRLNSIGNNSAILEQSSLSELHIQNNQIHSIEVDLWRLPEIKMLDVSCNNLTDIPFQLGFVNSLENMNLEGNPIRTIRRALISRQGSNTTAALKEYLRTRGENPFGDDGSLSSPKGKEVSIVDYRIREMYVLILHVELECIGVYAMVTISPIEWCIGEPKSVFFYHILQYTISLAHKITNILISTLPTTYRPDNGGTLNIQKMELGNDSSQAVFEKLLSAHTLLSLISIDLSRNKIEKIPQNMRVLDTLKELNLSNNLLNIGCSDNDKGLGWVPNSLTSLNLSGNKLSTADTEIVIEGAVSQLKILDLSQNYLTSLPTSIQSSGICELNAAFNQLTTLRGMDFRCLMNLEVLDLKTNKLKTSELSNIAHRQSCLRVLDLSNNDLSDLPITLGFIKSLSTLHLEGNLLRSVRQTLLQGGAEQLKEYLRNRAPTNLHIE